MENSKDGIGPLFYKNDESVGDSDRDIAFENAVHLYAACCESALANGHRIVNPKTGELIPFRVVLVRMEDLLFYPEDVYNRFCDHGFEATREFSESLLAEAYKGFGGLSATDPVRTMVQLRFDAMRNSHAFTKMRKAIKRDKWYQQTAWVSQAMHYPHSFELANCAFMLDPWSGSYPYAFTDAADEKLEQDAEREFNLLMGTATLEC